VLFNDVVALDVLVKLLISEGVAGLENDDGGVPEELCDLAGGVQNAFDD
jgi:hypothetical protein